MSKKDKIYLFIFILLPFFFFFKMYFFDKIIFWLDMLYYFMPMREICSENLKQNILPLWNPFIYCGNPLLANMQSAVFYPLNIFYYVFPFDIALRIGTYLTFFIMSTFFYFFIRLYNISEEASFFSSLIFSYNYYMLVKAVELADINVLMWIPAILYFTKKYILYKKNYDLLFLIFILSLTFLGGHLQVFSYAYLMFLLIFFYETVFYPENKQLLYFFKISFFITLTLLLIVSVQLLPTIKFILYSKRNVLGLGFEESYLTYLQIEQIFLFFFPFLINLFPPEINFYNWVSLINIGIPAVIIFFIGCYTIKDIKFKNFWFIILTLLLFICVLGNLPFYEFIFNHFKPLQYIRYVVKINIIILFIICFICAYGFDNIFNNEKDKLKKANSVFFIIFYLLLIILIFLIIFKIPLLRIYKKIFDPFMSFDKTYNMVLTFESFIKDFLIYLIYFLLTLLILYFTIKKIYSNIITKNFLIFLTFLILMSFGSYNFSYFNYDKIKKIETKILSKIKKTPDIINKRILSPGIIDPFKKSVYFENEMEYLNYQIETLYPNIPLLYKIRNVDGFDSLFIGNFHKFKLLMSYDEKPWDNNLFALFSSEYIIAKKELKGKNIFLKDKGVSYLYQNKNILDLAFFIPCNTDVLYIDEKDRDYKKKFKNFFDPREKIIFYLKDKDNIEKLKKEFKGTNKINKIISVTQNNINEYEVVVENEIPGFLILTDNYYPGWNVYVNEKKSKLYSAYLTFKSVFLNKGKNKVKFVFSDSALTIGLIFSLIIILIILIFTPIFIRKTI